VALQVDKDDQGPLAEAWAIFGPSHVPYRILLLGKMLDRLTAQQVRMQADLTLAEWRVIAHLAVIGQASASRLSSAALVDRAEISRAVRALTERGLVARHPQPKDRRSVLLGLTDKGRRVYGETHESRRRFFAGVTQDLDADELQQLDDYLFRIARVADRLMAEGEAGKAPPR